MLEQKSVTTWGNTWVSFTQTENSVVHMPQDYSSCWSSPFRSLLDHSLPREVERECQGRMIISPYPQWTTKCLTHLYSPFKHCSRVTSFGKPLWTPKARLDFPLYMLGLPALLPHHIYHVDDYFLSLSLDYQHKEAGDRMCSLPLLRPLSIPSS